MVSFFLSQKCPRRKRCKVACFITDLERHHPHYKRRRGRRRRRRRKRTSLS